MAGDPLDKKINKALKSVSQKILFNLRNPAGQLRGAEENRSSARLRPLKSVGHGSVTLEATLSQRPRKLPEASRRTAANTTLQDCACAELHKVSLNARHQ